MHELTGIAFSHYVEKARWALDRYAVPYRDRRVLPFLHVATVYRIHGGKLGQPDRASSRFSTPVLKTDDGRVLCDSAAIVRYASDRYAPAGAELYWSPEAAVLEQRHHDQLGPASRLLAYDAFFAQPALLHEVAARNVDRVQALAFRAAHALFGQRMRRFLGVSPEPVERALACVQRELDAVSTRLRDGRPYLLGDRFSAADLAFASLASPLVLPPEYSAWLPPLSDFSAALQARTREQRLTPVGAYVMRMFAEERRRVVRV